MEIKAQICRSEGNFRIVVVIVCRSLTNLLDDNCEQIIGYFESFNFRDLHDVDHSKKGNKSDATFPFFLFTVFHEDVFRSDFAQWRHVGGGFRAVVQDSECVNHTLGRVLL